MGDLLPIPMFGNDCEACYEEDETPAFFSLTFCGVKFCPVGGFGQCQGEPWFFPTVILPQNPLGGKECHYYRFTQVNRPFWYIEYDANHAAGVGPRAVVSVTYFWDIPIDGAADYFFSGWEHPICSKRLQNIYDVGDCSAVPRPRCGYDGEVVIIPHPDPNPREIIENLGWTDFSQWLYERNFDGGCNPVYRLHHFDPWDTFTVKIRIP